MRATLILNPAARSGRTGRMADAVLAEARRAGLDPTLRLTERPRHAAHLAAEAANSGAEAVVAVGGDGTVHEVAEGLVRAGVPVPLGVVPMGTGNDFAKMVGAAPGGRVRPWREALASLVGASVRAVDVGWVRWEEATGEGGGEKGEGGKGRAPSSPLSLRSSPFFNAVGMGFDARVAVEAPRFKRLGGTLAYLAAIGAVLRKWEAVHLTARTADGTVLIDGPFFLATAGNGVSSGGGFYLTPEARVDDGLLDVCAVDSISVARILTLIPLVMRGRHTREPEAHFARTTALSLELSAPCAIHVDGEVATRDAVRVEVHVEAGALRVLG
ncbi:MAG TPA: diacylglycerol kinase family protein [Rhodothermales bacterium]|nr:diacylglycerol kinase family protein [Rhodothermales bacterium]